MKIFVTVGFESFPFDRLLRAIDGGLEHGLIAGDIFVQTGPSRYQVQYCESKRFLDYDEIMSRLKEADIVVCHAGVGTTLLCLGLGKIPIIFPRQSGYHEHVDDHQIQFAQKMEKQGKALVAYDENDLLSKIGRHRLLEERLLIDRTQEKVPTLRHHLEEMLGMSADGKETSR
jgi:UDP-N-acetylglucosamine transferase subunit ALG13